MPKPTYFLKTRRAVVIFKDSYGEDHKQLQRVKDDLQRAYGRVIVKEKMPLIVGLAALAGW